MKGVDENSKSVSLVIVQVRPKYLDVIINVSVFSQKKKFQLCCLGKI